MSDKSKLEVVIEGKLILKETHEDGTTEEHELPRSACQVIVNHLIQTCVIAHEDLVDIDREETPIKHEDDW